jgi:hypothetical protein
MGRGPSTAHSLVMITEFALQYLPRDIPVFSLSFVDLLVNEVINGGLNTSFGVKVCNLYYLHLVLKRLLVNWGYNVSR